MIYELIGRMVVGFIRWRYGREGSGCSASDPTPGASAVPTPVVGSLTFSSLAASEHTCALTLGAGIGCVLAFLAYYLDQRVKTLEQAEEISGVPALAAVPLISAGELAGRAKRGRSELGRHDPKATKLLPAALQPRQARRAEFPSRTLRVAPVARPEDARLAGTARVPFLPPSVGHGGSGQHRPPSLLSAPSARPLRRGGGPQAP